MTILREAARGQHSTDNPLLNIAGSFLKLCTERAPSWVGRDVPFLDTELAGPRLSNSTSHWATAAPALARRSAAPLYPTASPEARERGFPR